MTTQNSKAASADVVATLEACVARLHGVRDEAEQGLALLHEAIAALRASQTLPRGADDFRDLLKAHHDRLAETLLGARPAEGEPAPGGYRFRMDPHQRVARIGRRRIPLTPSEYQVLELLWQQMPSPVSRQSLLEHLYGDRDHSAESVIDMFIFKIRQKLRNAGCTDASIKGIRGVGWALELDEPGEPSLSA